MYCPKDKEVYCPKDREVFCPKDEEVYCPKDKEVYYPKDREAYFPKDNKAYCSKENNTMERTHVRRKKEEKYNETEGEMKKIGANYLETSFDEEVPVTLSGNYYNVTRYKKKCIEKSKVRSRLRHCAVRSRLRHY